MDGAIMNVTPNAPMNRVSLGALVAVGEIFLMVIMSVLVKMMPGDVSTLTILFFRYALCLPLLVIGGLWQRGRDVFSVSRLGILGLRTMAGLISLSCFYAALDTLELAKVTTLFQTITLFVTFLAPFLLGEKVGWRRWSAVLIGFGGAVILIQPGGEGWAVTGTMFGLASPVFGAIMVISLRRLGHHDSPITTAILYNGIGALVFFGLTIFTNDAMSPFRADFDLSSQSIWMLVILGVIASFQQFFIAFSHKLAPASVLAPLRYLSIPMGIGCGILFFGEMLTGTVIFGSLVIVLSSLFILQREKRLQGDTK